MKERKGKEKEKERRRKKKERKRRGKKKEVPMQDRTCDLLLCSPCHYCQATASGINCTYQISVIMYHKSQFYDRGCTRSANYYCNLLHH